jgi:hypothetical protein
MHTYSQRSGNWIGPDDTLWGHGWSGQGQFQDDPDAQDIPKAGPLPRGFYQIGSYYHHPHLGPVTMNLKPYPENDMFGRADFRIHGAAAPPDTATSSEGCIIQGRATRERIANSLDDVLQVIE